MNQLQNTGPPPGFFDLNLTLNFAPQMRKEFLDYLYQTRDQILAQTFAVEWIVVALGAFLVGVLLTTCIALLISKLKGRGAAALLLALLCSVGAYAQEPREPMVDLITMGYVTKNLASRVNGSGCCVFASQKASFVSQYARDFEDYLDWVASNLPGGGYPSRVTEYVEAFCRTKRIPVPDYTQVVGEETLTAIREALEDGRAPAVTYSGDPAFYGGPVPHMVNCVYMDDRTVGIVDNNRIDRVEYMPLNTFIERHRHFDKGWCIIFHGKPQLPRPVNFLPRRDPRDSYSRPSFSLPSLRGTLDATGSEAQLTFGQSCPTCPQPRYDPRQPRYDPPRYQSDYTWEPMPGGGDGRRLRDSSGRYVGEEHNGLYYFYVPGGLSRGVCPFEQYSGGKITGVEYSRIPTPRRGRTMYGTAISELRDDDAGLRLFNARMQGDRAKPRIIINLEGVEDQLNAILARIQALERVFVYARDALEVIIRLGYGRGITVVSGTDRGVAVEVAYFESVPSDADLAEALTRADPTYRPGGGVTGGFDVATVALVVVVVLLGGLAILLGLRNTKRS